jgi:hypothetical protein
MYFWSRSIKIIYSAISFLSSLSLFYTFARKNQLYGWVGQEYK